MKLTKLVLAGLMILFMSSISAQVSIRLNIGTPPEWGLPVQTDVRYYYLPDVDAYYDLNSSNFIYFYNGNWIHRHHLPARFRNYDLYHGRKIVVHNYLGNTPYKHCNYHVNRDNRQRGFERMKGRAENPDQRIISSNHKKFHEERHNENNKKNRK